MSLETAFSLSTIELRGAPYTVNGECGGCMRRYAFAYPRFLSSLARAQPFTFLDSFLESGRLNKYMRERIFADYFETHNNPLTQISDRDIMAWCELKPSTRYLLLSSTIQAFSKIPETNQWEWKPIVFTMFEKAPDLSPILASLAGRIEPCTWSGSLANKLKDRSGLFLNLRQHDNYAIRVWASNQHIALQQRIENLRKWEDERHRDLDESFE